MGVETYVIVVISFHDFIPSLQTNKNSLIQITLEWTHCPPKIYHSRTHFWENNHINHPNPTHPFPDAHNSQHFPRNTFPFPSRLPPTKIQIPKPTYTHSTKHTLSAFITAPPPKNNFPMIPFHLSQWIIPPPHLKHCSVIRRMNWCHAILSYGHGANLHQPPSNSNHCCLLYVPPLLYHHWFWS